ncbi:MAG TPA: OmpA family protein [Stellaceae bacterium]|nr:OmpA family protein [Stellaceae bacterium]
MRNRCLLGAGVALAMAFGGVQAHAQFFGPYPPGAFYLGPEGGWTHLTSQNPSVTIQGPSGYIVGNTGNRQINYNAGFNAGVRAGYAWGPWRFEEEYSYRNNNVSNSGTVIGPHGVGFAESGGSAHSNSIMTNVIYDFTLGWPVTPHIGGGIGAIDVFRSIGGTGTATAPNGSTVNFTTNSFSGSKWGFGYQAIAGIRYMINPALALDVDYRYLASTNENITASSIPRHNVCCVITNVGNVKYGTQNVVASLTMMFGAPPPAAPPPAPPAPPPPPTHQVYLVFFDWDKYNITPEGMQILEAAAAHWKAGGAVQIQVTGYTDLTGSPGYNQRLSERRASAVAAVLERLGIPRGEMVVAGRGMNDPRVPTPLGVREPQNRRVEIVFP